MRQTDNNQTASDPEQWIATTLVNDEASTDSELIEHFMQGGEVPYEQAKIYVAQRGAALLHGLTFKLKSYDQ